MVFDGYELAHCVRVEIVSTLLSGKPSCVRSAVLRLHDRDGSVREVAVDFGGDGPMRETLDASIRALNAHLARPRPV